MIFSVLLLFIVSFLSPVLGENLVVNSDLSIYDFRTGSPLGWNNRPALSGIRKEHPDRQGRYVLSLQSQDRQTSAYWISPIPPIIPGQSYTASALVRIPQGQLFRIYIERNKPAFQSFHGNTWMQGTGKWQKISFGFNYRTKGSAPYLVFCVRSPEECLAADFKVEKCTDAPQSQKNEYNGH